MAFYSTYIMNRVMDLIHKVALITGASQGLGSCIASLFAEHGMHVILVARSVNKLKRHALNIKHRGGSASFFPADISKEISVKRLFHHIRMKFGRLDILVNNAGILKLSLLAQTRLKDWNEVLAVNLTGSFLYSREAFKLMKKQKSGNIIFISSRSGVWGSPKYPRYSSYCSSKYGLLGLMEVIAQEGSPFGIRSNMICPGGMKTAMFKKSHPSSVGSAMESMEVAKKVLFLASDESKFLNGQILDMPRK